MSESDTMQVAILGTGATGSFLGGLLQRAGVPVVYLARDRWKNDVTKSGRLRLTDYQGLDIDVHPNLTSEQNRSNRIDVLFVMVKGHQLASTIEQIREVTSPDSIIYFMQNGIGAVESVLPELQDRQCYRGITLFNVLTLPNAHYHKSTQGDFYLASTSVAEVLAHRLDDHSSQLNTSIKPVDDIQAVINGKLLLNLNNALNAIVDQPIKQELLDARWRKVLAEAMSEWLQICSRNQQRVAQLTQVPPHWIPRILRLPTIIFRMIARSMLAIDPTARSSMWEDVQQKRATEVTFLNGAVTEAADKLGLKAPINQLVTECIRKLETDSLQQTDIEALLSAVKH